VFHLKWISLISLSVTACIGPGTLCTQAYPDAHWLRDVSSLPTSKSHLTKNAKKVLIEKLKESKNKHCNRTARRQSRTRSPLRQRRELHKTNHQIKGNTIPQTADQRPQESQPLRKLPHQLSNSSNKLHISLPKNWPPGDQKNPRWQQSGLHVNNNDPSLWPQRNPWEPRNHSQQIHNSINRCWRFLPISETETSEKRSLPLLQEPTRRRSNQHQTLHNEVRNAIKTTCFCRQMLWAWCGQKPRREWAKACFKTIHCLNWQQSRKQTRTCHQTKSSHNTSKLSTCMPSFRKDSNIDWTTATQQRSQSFWTSQRQFQKQTQQQEEDNLFLHSTF